MYDTDVVVIADAVHDDAKPGTLSIYREDDLLSRRAQLRLTAHAPGVQESLAQLRLAGHAPSEVIIVGVVPESCGLGSGMSRSVMDAAPEAVAHIADVLGERAVLRSVPAEPNLWWMAHA